jgi:hypothetical protein
MLNRKNLLWLIGILVVLIVVSLAQRTSHERATSRALSEVLIAGQFAQRDLGRVTIAHGQDPAAIVLSSTPEGWQVDTAWNARASTQRLDTLLGSLGDLRGEFRSDSAAVLGDYGFTDTTTILLTGHDPQGQQVFAIEIGGRPEQGMGNFVKRPGENAVFLTSQGLLSNLGLWSGPGRPESRHFLELQAFRRDREDIDTIRLEGEERLVLTKEFAMIEPAPEDTVFTEPFPDRSQWEWRLGDGRRAQKTRADGVLGAVSNIRAQDVVDPAVPLAEYGLADPARRAILVLKDGTELVLAFGHQREAAGTAPGGYYTRIGDGPTIWVVGEFNVNNIFKSRSDLLPED